MKRVVLVVVLLSFVVMTAACNAPASPGGNVRHHAMDTIDDSNPRARLVLGSKDLLGQIALTNARLGSAGRLAKGEVTVQNLSNHRYTLEYQYAWEDRDGFSISENRVWKRFVLGPRGLESFHSIAGDPRAYGFTLTVRLPDDVFIQQDKFLERQ